MNYDDAEQHGIATAEGNAARISISRAHPIFDKKGNVMGPLRRITSSAARIIPCALLLPLLLAALSGCAVITDNQNDGIDERAERLFSSATGAVSDAFGSVNVAEISVWPEKGIARFDVTVNESEGIFLFGSIGITTKDSVSLSTTYFRIPDDTAKYIAKL